MNRQPAPLAGYDAERPGPTWGAGPSRYQNVILTDPVTLLTN
jgi:hypothetical protein